MCGFILHIAAMKILISPCRWERPETATIVSSFARKSSGNRSVLSSRRTKKCRSLKEQRPKCITPIFRNIICHPKKMYTQKWKRWSGISKLSWERSICQPAKCITRLKVETVSWDSIWSAMVEGLRIVCRFVALVSFTTRRSKNWWKALRWVTPSLFWAAWI